MSLVMAVICTDGIVVSGDFRRTEYAFDKNTKQYIPVDYTDNTHKLFRTKSNRIIAYTGRTTNEHSFDIDERIKEMVDITDSMKLPLRQQLTFLIEYTCCNTNAIIEVGIENGQKTIMEWNQQSGMSYGVQEGMIGAIGATEVITKHQKEIEVKLKERNVVEAAEILKEYNKLTSIEDRTVSPECEIEIIV